MSGLLEVHRIALHLPVAHRSNPWNPWNPCRSALEDVAQLTLTRRCLPKWRNKDERTNSCWKTWIHHVSKEDMLA